MLWGEAKFSHWSRMQAFCKLLTLVIIFLLQIEKIFVSSAAWYLYLRFYPNSCISCWTSLETSVAFKTFKPVFKKELFWKKRSIIQILLHQLWSHALITKKLMMVRAKKCMTFLHRRKRKFTATETQTYKSRFLWECLDVRFEKRRSANVFLLKSLMFPIFQHISQKQILNSKACVRLWLASCLKRKHI